MLEGVPSFLSGVTPGSAGIWFIAAMVAVHFFREWRLTRRLSLDDRLARRDGYAAQVTGLMVENRSLRTEMDKRDLSHQARIIALEGKYDKYRELCEHTEEQHRKEILGLMDKVAGLGRQIAAYETAKRRTEGDPK